MKIIPNIKESFGDTYFLGYSEKMKFDQATNRRTDEIEARICKVSSSVLQEQIEVIVAPTVDITKIRFNQKVTLNNVVIEPYARTTTGSSFAQIILRCTADSITFPS